MERGDEGWKGGLDLFWLGRGGIFLRCGGTRFDDAAAMRRMRPLSAQRQLEKGRMLERLNCSPMGECSWNPSLILLRINVSAGINITFRHVCSCNSNMYKYK